MSAVRCYVRCDAAGEKSLVTGSKDSELKIKKALRKKQKVMALCDPLTCPKLT